MDTDMNNDTAAKGAYYTGETFDYSAADKSLGGAQYIAKLYTEGLGRAPTADEYIAFRDILANSECSPEALASLALTVFGGVEFKALELSGAETAMAVWRAILNRDPTEAEADDFSAGGKSAVELAAELTGSETFTALYDAIVGGPYFWDANSTDFSTSGNIIKASELQAELDMLKPGKVYALPRGTVIHGDVTLVIPRAITLCTEGFPAHYTRMARIIRTRNCSDALVTLSDGATLRAVWCDGNRAGFKGEERIVGHTVILNGNSAELLDSRVSDTMSGTHVYGADSKYGQKIAGNLITCYSSDHINKAWADGITHAATGSIIEDNDVIDATDVGIIVFRYVSADNDVAQNTTVRNNRIINLGNSAYAGLDIDSWHSQKLTLDFTGCVFSDNILWTSMRAHQHICLSFAPLAWTNIIGDTGIGASYINNRTPDGLSVVCGAGIAVDGVTDVTVRGNRLNLYICDIGGESVDKALGARLYSINMSNSSGELQPGWEDMPMHIKTKGGAGFIVGPVNEPLQNIEYRAAVICEATVDG